MAGFFISILWILCCIYVIVTYFEGLFLGYFFLSKWAFHIGVQSKLQWSKQLSPKFGHKMSCLVNLKLPMFSDVFLVQNDPLHIVVYVKIIPKQKFVTSHQVKFWTTFNYLFKCFWNEAKPEIFSIFKDKIRKSTKKDDYWYFSLSLIYSFQQKVRKRTFPER